MKIWIAKSKSCGMEVYKVFVDGYEMAVFMSEGGARVKYLELRSKLLGIK